MEVLYILQYNFLCNGFYPLKFLDNALYFSYKCKII